MIYLLHFDRPCCGRQHYIGYCADDRLLDRMTEHAKGRGSAFTRNMMRNGIAATVARTWPGADRAFERRLKNAAHYERRCPICNPAVDSELHAEQIRVLPALLPPVVWTGISW